jgi:hypothetical protein
MNSAMNPTAANADTTAMPANVTPPSFEPEVTLAARRRAVTMLTSAVLTSAALGALIFWAVLKGEWMTDAFTAAARWMVDYPVWAVAAGLSPLVATLLVGYGYAERAIRRRA